MLVIAVPVAAVGLAFLSIAADPLGLNGGSSGHFPNALEWASPDPWNREAFTGFENATATFLNRSDQGRDFNKNLRFVDGDTPSTGNLVVSVRPIDRFTWAATALASNGRCYALLVAHDRRNPEYGSEYYARFPKGTPCSASNATPQAVRRTTAPD